MSTLQELRGGVNHFWNALAEGWRHLVARASGALTHFHAAKSKDDFPDVQRGSEWGLLAAELYDDDEKVIIRLEAPGMELDDFDVSVSEDVLLIRGQKHYQKESNENGYQIAECAYGIFERAIPLPDNIDSSKAKAKYRRGVLRVEMLKTAHRRHTVKVQAL